MLAKFGISFLDGLGKVWGKSFGGKTYKININNYKQTCNKLNPMNGLKQQWKLFLSCLDQMGVSRCFQLAMYTVFGVESDSAVRNVKLLRGN